MRRLKNTKRMYSSKRKSRKDPSRFQSLQNPHRTNLVNVIQTNMEHAFRTNRDSIQPISRFLVYLALIIDVFSARICGFTRNNSLSKLLRSIQPPPQQNQLTFGIVNTDVVTNKSSLSLAFGFTHEGCVRGIPFHLGPHSPWRAAIQQFWSQK